MCPALTGKWYHRDLWKNKTSCTTDLLPTKQRILTPCFASLESKSDVPIFREGDVTFNLVLYSLLRLYQTFGVRWS